MKNNIESDSPMKKTTPTAADLQKVAPFQESWEIDGTKGHLRDNSQGSASDQYKTT